MLNNPTRISRTLATVLIFEVAAFKRVMSVCREAATRPETTSINVPIVRANTAKAVSAEAAANRLARSIPCLGASLHFYGDFKLQRSSA